MVEIDEDRIGDLLIEWDQGRQRGDEISAAELCRDCPELIPEIACRIESLKATDWLYQEPAFEEPDGLSLPPLDWTLIRASDSTLLAAVIPCDEFVQRLAGSGLVTAHALADAQASLAPDQAQNTRLLAGELVRRKKLTPYQAGVLCAGTSRPLVLGDYEILDRLGAGGMGEVFKARHRRMKRVVALKVLPASVTDSPSALQRFQREVEVAAKLNHPNIAPAYDAREDQGTHYLITEFVDGQTLSGLVKHQGPLPVHEAVRCIRQVALGLEYAHQRGVVHRDIKPSNLILGQDGVMKIIDMGLARLEIPRGDDLDESTRDELTGSETVMGTVDYMAPEQAVHTKTADARADIYSLGCTLYFLLTGQPMYNGQTALERFLAHREHPIPALHSTREDVPVELDAVFQKMVAKKPEDRIPRMAAVIEALDGLVVSDEPSTLTAAAPAPAAETEAVGLAETLTYHPDTAAAPPTRGWPKRWRSALIGALALLLVGGVWLGGIIFKVQTPEGTIVLECSQPELNGAMVTVDGQQKLTITTDENAEPITIKVDKGRRLLEVVKGGFKTFTDEVEINPGQAKNIKVHLEPLTEPPPVAPAARTATPQQPQVSDRGSARRAAEFVVGLGGTVGVYSKEGEAKYVSSAAELPTQPFELRSVYFYDGKSVTDSGLAALARLCSGMTLEAFRIDGGPITDAGLAPLLGEITIPSFGSLTLGGVPISDDGLKHLRGRSFRQLELPGTKITDEGLRYVAEVTELGELNLISTSIGDVGLGYLKPLAKLGVLQLDGTKVTDQGLECISNNHPGLRGLGVSRTSVTDEGMEYVARLRYLDSFQAGPAVGNKGLARLASLTTLTSLGLRSTQVGDEGLKHMAGLVALANLDLGGTKVSDEGMTHLSKLAKLQVLYLDGTQVIGPGLKHLGGLTAIRELDLKRTKVTNDGLQHLAGLPQLKTLSLAATPVSDEGLAHLSKLAMLEDLDLYETQVGDAGLPHLYGLSNLRVLNIGTTKVTDAGVAALKAALPKCEVRR